MNGNYATAELAKVTITDEAREEVARLREQILSEQSHAYRQMRGDLDTVTFSAAQAFGGEQQPAPAYQPGGGVMLDLSGTGARFAGTRPEPAPVAASWRPRCGAVSAGWVGGIAYPDPHDLTGGLNPRLYAQALRHIGMATGTCSPYESDAAWRLAIETGTTT